MYNSNKKIQMLTAFNQISKKKKNYLKILTYFKTNSNYLLNIN